MASNVELSCMYYKMFKENFSFEYYLDVLNIRKFGIMYSNFRIGSHDLKIEVGRHKKVIRENRQNVLLM